MIFFLQINQAGQYLRNLERISTVSTGYGNMKYFNQVKAVRKAKIKRTNNRRYEYISNKMI